VYICLFICTTSRAIHLDLEEVTDLTVDTGHSEDLLIIGHSHRLLYQTMQLTIRQLQTNFTDLHSKHLTKALGREGVQWQFILKCAPWYGEWWEHPIGLIKMSLKKILGRARVSLVVLQTVIVEVEAVLNDRPLTHVFSNLEDAKPLTFFMVTTSHHCPTQ